MSETQEVRIETGEAKTPGHGSLHAATIYFIVAGVVLLGVAVWSVALGSDAAAAAVAILGGGALIVAPFAPYVEGRFKLGGLEMNIAQRLMDAAARAGPGEVQGVLSLLESPEIGIEIVRLPATYVGETLEEGAHLSHWRPDYNVSAMARKRPDEPWVPGGQLTSEKMQLGTLLLVSGPHEGLERLRSELHSAG